MADSEDAEKTDALVEGDKDVEEVGETRVAETGPDEAIEAGVDTESGKEVTAAPRPAILPK